MQEYLSSARASAEMLHTLYSKNVVCNSFFMQFSRRKGDKEESVIKTNYKIVIHIKRK